MLQITKSGNIVTENEKNYFSINVERWEVAHLINWKIDSYIKVNSSEIQKFIIARNFERISKYYNEFSKISYNKCTQGQVMNYAIDVLWYNEIITWDDLGDNQKEECIEFNN